MCVIVHLRVASSAFSLEIESCLDDAYVALTPPSSDDYAAFTPVFVSTLCFIPPAGILRNLKNSPLNRTLAGEGFLKTL